MDQARVRRLNDIERLERLNSENERKKLRLESLEKDYDKLQQSKHKRDYVATSVKKNLTKEKRVKKLVK